MSKVSGDSEITPVGEQHEGVALGRFSKACHGGWEKAAEPEAETDQALGMEVPSEEPSSCCAQ